MPTLKQIFTLAAELAIDLVRGKLEPPCPPAEPARGLPPRDSARQARASRLAGAPFAGPHLVSEGVRTYECGGPDSQYPCPTCWPYSPFGVGRSAPERPHRR